jgi:hypothetical protein
LPLASARLAEGVLKVSFGNPAPGGD